MRNRCEASGLKVKANADGRATCPLCGDAWHVVTAAGKLRPHARISHRDLSPEEIERILEQAAREAER